MVTRDLRGVDMALEMARLPGLAKSGLAMFGTKLIVQIIPSIAATVIGGYLLAQIHLGSSAPPDQPTQQTAPANAANDDRPTVREDRAAMRQVLRARRENPEPPATVKPKVAAVPAPAPLAPAMDSIAPNEPAAHAPARASVAAVPRSRPEVADYVPAPPPGLPSAPAVSPLASQPTPITPVAPVARVAPAVPAVAAPNAAPPVVQVAPVAPAPAAPVVANATPVAPPASPTLPLPAIAPSGPQVVTALPDPATPAQEPPPRGPVGAVFSTLSSFVGHAANATGHTVNWVIDLPGKAIQAGGRVIGVDDPAPPSPPPPARPFS